MMSLCVKFKGDLSGQNMGMSLLGLMFKGDLSGTVNDLIPGKLMKQVAKYWSHIEMSHKICPDVPFSAGDESRESRNTERGPERRGAAEPQAEVGGLRVELRLAGLFREAAKWLWFSKIGKPQNGLPW